MLKTTSAAVAQCRANVEAVLAMYRLPVGLPMVMRPDRVFYQCTRDFVSRLEGITAAWNVPGGFRRFDVGIQAHHGVTAITGWREKVPWASMQIIRHAGFGGDAETIEIDLDLANPDGGAGPALGHMVEVLWPGKTNPFRIRKRLLGRGIEVPDVREAA